MKTLRRTSQFKKDVKRMVKRGMEFSEFKNIIVTLEQGLALDPKFLDHSLYGRYKSVREYHIEPDWLLMYESTKEDVILIRTGTHSDLFQ